jgi:hypothetical protein
MRALLASSAVAFLAAASCATALADSGIVINPANGHSYQRIDTVLTWSSARSTCAGRGGYLATLTSQAENDFVYANVAQQGVDTWLGGTDEVVEGTWQWVTGEPFTYANWFPGQPDNNAGSGQDYLAFTSFDTLGRWDDAGLPATDMSRAYICEWNASSAWSSGFIPITTSAVDRLIPAHDVGFILLPGHGATGTTAVPGWTFNYTGNFTDTRYPAYMSAFNTTYLCVGPTPLPSNYDCNTDDLIPPAGNDYAGFEYLYFPFTLPAGATNVRLYINFLNADDRLVFALNGTDYGMFDDLLPGNPDLSTNVVMAGASGNVPYTVVHNSQNGVQETSPALFNIGGVNYLRVWINNTGNPDPGQGTAVARNGSNPSGLNFWGYVTYSMPTPAAAATEVPLFTPVGLGLVSILLGGVGALSLRRRRQ